MSAVYLITGVSAAGKSTVARMLAERFERAAAVSGDAVLREGTPRIGLWLDTSELTPEQTVDAILARAPAEAAL
jgi:cytidylate kinase